MPINDAALRRLVWPAAGALLLALLYVLSPVLTPFILASVLAYICEPLVTWFQKRRMPRTAAVLLVMVLLFLLLSLLALTVVPLFAKELSQLVRALPGFLDWLNGTLAPWIQTKTGIAVSFDAAAVKEHLTEWLRTTEGLGSKLADSLLLGGLGLIGLAANVVLVPVVQFYLMRDWGLFASRAERLIPREWRGQTLAFMRDADAALAQYLHGQILVILVMACYYSVSLWLAGLEFWLPIGIITGVLVFIPYLGAATGFALGTLAAALQFHGLAEVLWVWLAFGVGQALEGNFVTPKLVGERIGLHPVAVIFALLAFGQLFGLAGLLVALPASAVLLVALRKLRTRYLASSFYTGQK